VFRKTSTTRRLLIRVTIPMIFGASGGLLLAAPVLQASPRSECTFDECGGGQEVAFPSISLSCAFCTTAGHPATPFSAKLSFRV
jgi:hypothetical protein